MKFSPKTREEIETMNLLQPGTYEFRVASAKDKISKSGNEMIELSLEVYDREGRSTFLFDYLLEAMPAKLYTFCEVTGMMPMYHKGTLDSSHCLNLSGYVELAIKKGGVSQSGDNYPDRNEVKRYCLRPVSGSRPGDGQHVRKESAPKDEPFFEDDMPF